ncbi:MAG: glycosyltransferase family 4 protein [Acidobacteriota bacterium]
MRSRIRIARMITRMDLGGAQQAVLALARDLDAKKFDQAVITGMGGELFSDLASIRHIRLYVVPELDRSIRLAGLGMDLRAMLRIRQILRLEQPDIVHTHTPKAGIVGRWAGWLAGVPRIIHTFHGFGFSDRHPFWQRQSYLWAERLVRGVTDRSVVVSESNRAKGLRLRLFRSDRCVLIRSGIDFPLLSGELVDKTKKKLELGFSPSDRIVGVVAGFKPPKALDHFLHAAAILHQRVPDLKFLMVGDGELRSKLEAQRHALGLDAIVKMTGWRRDVGSLIQVLDVFVLTSLWEGLPRVLVEALFLGVPAVATNVDGVSEVVQDGKSGYLVAPADVEALADRVLRILQDDQLRIRLGEAGKHSVSQFSAEKMLSDYASLYREVAAVNGSTT